MDRIFDRLTNLVRSFLQDDEGNPVPGDPDLADAMDELDEYLATGRSPSSGPASKSKPEPPVSDQLRSDFASLDCTPGDSPQRVKQAYKQLLRQYHPDRHQDDPEKLRVATEITQKINGAYRRIRAHQADTQLR